MSKLQNQNSSLKGLDKLILYDTSISLSPTKNLNGKPPKHSEKNPWKDQGEGSRLPGTFRPAIGTEWDQTYNGSIKQAGKV